MKQWPVVIAIVAVLIGLTIWESTRSGNSLPVPEATSTPDIIAGVPNATYTNSSLGFSMQYPSTATSSAFDFGGFLPLTQTPLVSFVLPASMSQGTNLGQAGVYIGATTTPAIVANCLVVQTTLNEVNNVSTTIDGTDFIVATSTGVGAGNIYEEKVFRTVKNGACLEIVEMLHSGNIHNYPPGKVVEFDHSKFSGILESIVQTFKPLSP